MAEKAKHTSLSQKFKQIFVAGILACLPLVVTVYLILFFYRLITGAILPVVMKIAAKFHYVFPPYMLQFSALVVVFVFIFFVGLITKAYIGGRIFRLIEKIMSTIPIARTIYNGTKQVIDSLRTTSGSTFSKVVLVEFPRRDMWMIGFVVKDAQEIMTDVTINAEGYNVFIPTAPNPTSGFVAVVGRDQVRDLNISVEDAVKFILSVGLVSLSPDAADETISKAAAKHVL